MDILGDIPARRDTRVSPFAQPGGPFLSAEVLLEEEAAVHPMTGDDGLEELWGDAGPLGMGFMVLASACADSAGDDAVVIEAIDGHASHEGAWAVGELDSLTDKIGGVLAELAIEIVDGEEGVEPGSRGGGGDLDVEELEGEVWDAAEGAGVCGMFV